MKRFPGATAATLTVPDQDDSQVQEIDYVRWLMQMQADLAASLGGVMLQGALPVPIGMAPGGSARPLSSAGRIVGWSIHETSGTAPALVILWNSRTVGEGQPLAYIHIAEGLVETTWLGQAGISVTDAVSVQVALGGTIEGCLYLGAVD